MRFDNINEGVAKIACTKCDEVSTAKAWEKNNGFCPKCKTSSQGVAESEDTRMGTITVTSDEERKRRAKAYRDKKLKEAKGLASIDWPDEDMAQHAENAIRHGMHAYDAYSHVYSMTLERDWMQAHKDELIKMFASYGLATESVVEERKRRAKAYRDKKLKEAEGEGTYARIIYDYSENWASIDIYKGHEKVDEWDDYFHSNETGNPLARQFVAMCKKNGLDPMTLPLVDENGDTGKFDGKTFKWEDSVTEVSTEKLRDYASAALQDKNKAKADKRWKYAGKAMQTVADREVKAKHDLKYNKTEAFEEKTLTPAEKKKREEIAKAMERENPGMPMAKKMAIATATAKKVAEEVELNEAETNYVIKHKKTKQVLSTHSNYNDAKDEHSGISDKQNYSIFKQTKKDAALRNRNTYREEVEELEEYIRKNKFSKMTSTSKSNTKGVERFAIINDNDDIEVYNSKTKRLIRKVRMSNHQSAIQRLKKATYKSSLDTFKGYQMWYKSTEGGVRFSDVDRELEEAQAAHDRKHNNVKEALTLDYSRYMRSHGKKPKPGHGMWMFTTTDMGEPAEDDMFQFSGNLADAKRAAAKWAKGKGAYRFFVMEKTVTEDDCQCANGETTQEQLLDMLENAMISIEQDLESGKLMDAHALQLGENYLVYEALYNKIKGGAELGESANQKLDEVDWGTVANVALTAAPLLLGPVGVGGALAGMAGRAALGALARRGGMALAKRGLQKVAPNLMQRLGSTKIGRALGQIGGQAAAGAALPAASGPDVDRPEAGSGTSQDLLGLAAQSGLGSADLELVKRAVAARK